MVKAVIIKVDSAKLNADNQDEVAKQIVNYLKTRYDAPVAVLLEDKKRINSVSNLCMAHLANATGVSQWFQTSPTHLQSAINHIAKLIGGVTQSETVINIGDGTIFTPINLLGD